jgi:hypothetical protein
METTEMIPPDKAKAPPNPMAPAPRMQFVKLNTAPLMVDPPWDSVASAVERNGAVHATDKIHEQCKNSW